MFMTVKNLVLKIYLISLLAFALVFFLIIVNRKYVLKSELKVVVMIQFDGLTLLTFHFSLLYSLF